MNDIVRGRCTSPKGEVWQYLRVKDKGHWIVVHNKPRPELQQDTDISEGVSALLVHKYTAITSVLLGYLMSALNINLPANVESETQEQVHPVKIAGRYNMDIVLAAARACDWAQTSEVQISVAESCQPDPVLCMKVGEDILLFMPRGTSDYDWQGVLPPITKDKT